MLAPHNRRRHVLKTALETFAKTNVFSQRGVQTGSEDSNALKLDRTKNFRRSDVRAIFRRILRHGGETSSRLDRKAAIGKFRIR